MVEREAITRPSGQWGKKKIMAVNGTKKNDLLVEVATRELLSGHDGDEVINGHDGDDVIRGGKGKDNIKGQKGRDSLYGDGGDDKLIGGVGDDLLEGGAGADNINGGAGIDTLSYASSAEGVIVDLARGVASGGDAEGDNFSNVENISGSQVGDVLIGDAGNNVMNGNDGRDFLTGGAGADQLDGGAGIDDAEYVGSDAGVTVNLVTGTGLGGHAEGDVLANIEYVHGSMFDDHLIGNEQTNRLVGRLGEDKLEGRGGNDCLLGGRGADILDGGDGSRDAADYSWSDYGVHVNLKEGTGSLGDAEGDQLISIEFLYGSDYSDVFIGDNGVNRLVGRAGNDTLDGGAGNDILVGGEGADVHVGGEGTRDAADYEAAASGVGVDLQNGGFEGEATGDTFSGVEYVYGSNYGDKIVGDNGVNRLVGRAGNDIIDGGAGNDYLLGDFGDDILVGGDGDDVFVFHAGDGQDVIKDFKAGHGRTDRIWLKDFSDVYDFSDLESRVHKSGTGVEIDFGTDGSLVLEGLTWNDFAADDFIF